MNRRNLFLSLTLSVASGVLLGACSESPAGPSSAVTPLAPSSSQNAPAIPDISGDWTFHEDATFLLYDFEGGNATKAFRCSSDGTYTFVQTGDAFTGSFDQVGSCTAADGTTFPLNFTDAPVTGGTIQGHHVSFVADGCQYEGALRGPTLSEMGGAGQCSGLFPGIYRVSWSATR